jgi:hypothetical protein
MLLMLEAPEVFVRLVHSAVHAAFMDIKAFPNKFKICFALVAFPYRTKTV